MHARVQVGKLPERLEGNERYLASMWAFVQEYRERARGHRRDALELRSRGFEAAARDAEFRAENAEWLAERLADSPRF